MIHRVNGIACAHTHLVVKLTTFLGYVAWTSPGPWPCPTGNCKAVSSCNSVASICV